MCCCVGVAFDTRPQAVQFDVGSHGLRVSNTIGYRPCARKKELVAHFHDFVLVMLVRDNGPSHSAVRCDDGEPAKDSGLGEPATGAAQYIPVTNEPKDRVSHGLHSEDWLQRVSGFWGVGLKAAHGTRHVLRPTHIVSSDNRQKLKSEANRSIHTKIRLPRRPPSWHQRRHAVTTSCLPPERWLLRVL